MPPSLLLPTLNLLLTRRFHSMVDQFTAICKYLSWSSVSDWQEGVQIGSLTTILAQRRDREDRQVFRRSGNLTVNTVTLNGFYNVSILWPKNVFRKRDVYPSNVWFITVIAFSSVGLLRNYYFKINSNAPSNLICNIWKFIFYSLRQFFDVYRMILH